LKAFGKFPIYNSCTLQGKSTFQNIDWSRVDSNLEAAVCIARVVRELKSVDLIADLLRLSGLTVEGARPTISTSSDDLREMNQGVLFEAIWPIKKNGLLARGSLLESMFTRLFGQHVSVVIRTSPAFDIIDVNCTSVIE